MVINIHLFRRTSGFALVNMLFSTCPTGQEYPAIVEFAPFQKTAKKRSKKKDAKCGTITEGKSYF